MRRRSSGSFWKNKQPGSALILDRFKVAGIYFFKGARKGETESGGVVALVCSASSRIGVRLTISVPPVQFAAVPDTKSWATREGETQGGEETGGKSAE